MTPLTQTLPTTARPDLLGGPLRLLIDGAWVEGGAEPLSIIDPSAASTWWIPLPRAPMTWTVQSRPPAGPSTRVRGRQCRRRSGAD